MTTLSNPMQVPSVDEEAVSAEQSAELDRRIARYEQDRAAVIPWEQIKAELFKS